MRITVHQLICDDLGYCCEYAFFCVNKKTAKIADRLGITTRAVQKHKALVRDRCVSCESCPNCLKAKGALEGRRPPR